MRSLAPGPSAAASGPSLKALLPALAVATGSGCGVCEHGPLEDGDEFPVPLAGESLVAGELTSDVGDGPGELETRVSLDEYGVEAYRYEVPLVLELSGDAAAIAYADVFAQLYGFGCGGVLTLEVSPRDDDDDRDTATR